MTTQQEIVDVEHYANLNFCPRCGYLLNYGLVEDGVMPCDMCNAKFNVEDIKKAEFISSEKVPYESKYLAQLEAQTQSTKKPSRATVREECPKCKNPEMSYYTMQTRSADEGQTVFYECLKCSYSYKLDT